MLGRLWWSRPGLGRGTFESFPILLVFLRFDRQRLFHLFACVVVVAVFCLRIIAPGWEIVFIPVRVCVYIGMRR